ncbi:unnamed protein product, partial [Ectocarpus sp. 8 AP-2014]
KVDTAAKGWVEESQFEALMEAVGTTYAVEDHKPKLLAICKDGRLERQAFLAWYMDWLFGDEESSDEEGEVKSSVAAEGSKDAGFAALVRRQAGGWKCAACLVSNAEAALKCASCETVRPGQEGKVAASSAVGGAGILGGSGGGPTGGFTFGAPVPTVAKTATAGSTVPADSGAGGFSFGAPSAVVGATSSSAASSKPSAGTNATGGFTFGAPVVTESSASAPAAGPSAATVVADSSDDDGGSDSDSGDEEERREEKAKAEAAFDKVDTAAKGWVEESQFEALMEAVGTTYAVEDHKPKLLAICKDGRLERQAFLAWYMDWLFGDEESSDEEGEVKSSVAAEGWKDAGFAALVKSQAGGWKCAACLVSNAEAALKCASCETVRPGQEGKVAASSAVGGAGILGGSGSGPTGGFTFGSPVAPVAKTAAASAAAPAGSSGGGFSFGAPSPAPGAIPSPAASLQPSAGTNAAGGFTFGAPVMAASAADTGAATPAIVPADKAEVAPTVVGNNADDDSDGGSDSDSGDEEERREERAKAEAAFDKVDNAAKGWVEENQFEALMEAVGTTYAVEDHKPKLLAICTDGRLERQAFLTWYMDWLFGEEESSDEEGEVQSRVTAEGSKDAGFAALVKSQAGGWKCAACLVSNAEAALKCASCETAKPGEEGNVGAGILGGPSSGSAGGFTFGTPCNTAVATVTAGGFSFGVSPPAQTSAVPAEKPESKPCAGSGDTGGDSAGGAGLTSGSSTGGLTFGSLPGPAADEHTVAISSGSSVDVGGSVCDTGSDSGDEEERREEKAKAEKAFAEVDSAAKGWVEESQFEALMEAVGTTYAVEDHKPKLLAICTDGRLGKQAFLAWYMDWLFGDEESSDEEGEVKSSVAAEGSKDAGFAALVRRQAGGWKCAACLVSNAEAALKCASCETVRPGQEGKVAASSAVGGAGILGGSGSGPTGGFTFGSPVAPVAKTAAASSTAPAGSSGGGFSFGAPSPAAGATPLPAASLQPSAGTNAAGGFTFGAPVAAKSSASATDTAPAPDVVSVDTVDGEPALVADGLDVDSDNDSEDEEERREERAKAEKAFAEVDSAAKGWVEESQFEALMEAVGTTYAVEDHKPKLLAICTNGRLERQAFLAWYMDWLFGDEESSDGEWGEGDESSPNAVGRAPKDAGFASLVKSQAGRWKCAACLVSNAEAALKCASCETVRPGREGKVAASGVLGGAGILGGSISGVFGAPVPAAASAAPAVATSSSSTENKDEREVATKAPPTGGSVPAERPRGRGNGGGESGAAAAAVTAGLASKGADPPAGEGGAAGGFTSPTPRVVATAPSRDGGGVGGDGGGSHFFGPGSRGEVDAQGEGVAEAGSSPRAG